jgi:hypothetical protein
MVLPLHPRWIRLQNCEGPEKAKNPAEKILRLIQIRVATPSFEEIWPASQAKSMQARSVAGDTLATTIHRLRAVSSVVEQLVYTEFRILGEREVSQSIVLGP